MNCHEDLVDLMRMIAAAELFPARRRDGSNISGHAQKSVLYTVALFQLHPISVRAIADRACCCQTTALLALEALVKDGVVVRKPGSGRTDPSSYQVCRIRLAELRMKGSPFIHPEKRKRISLRSTAA